MRKRIAFLSFAAAIAFCYSCSNDETVAVNTTPQDNEISFRPLMTGMTRAIDASFGDASTFKVTAFPQGTTTPYFSNVVFTGSGGTFSSAAKYYWPSTTNLDFYAWAPATVSDNYASIPITVASDAASQIDLVYAVTKDWGKVAVQTGTPAGHFVDGSTVQGVAINFRHAESKVAINLKNSVNTLTITVSNVEIGNISGSGTFAIAETNTDGKDNAKITSGWSSIGAATSSYSQAISPAVYTTTAAAGEEMILIPQTLTEATTYTKVGSTPAANDPFDGPFIKVQMKIQNAADGSYILGAASGANEYVTAMWPLPTTTWAPGYKYTYTVELSGGGYNPVNADTDAELDPILGGSEIKFVTVTVDDWSDGGTEFVDAPSYVAGKNRTLDVRAEESTYTFYVTGFTANESVTISKTDANSVIKTLTTGATTADASGVLKITFTVNESTGAHDATITIDSATDSHDTTITVSQPATS